MKKSMLSILCLTLILPLAGASANGPYIESRWTTSPPTIDGVFSPAEWISPQIAIDGPIHTFAYFVNDKDNMYVMVDALNDTTDDGLDDCLLWFYSSGVNKSVEIYGFGGTTHTNDFNAKIGFGTSPNEMASHKIYEFRIPLALINGQPCHTVYFCSPPFKEVFGRVSMPFDQTSDLDNIYPTDVDLNDVGTWAILKLANDRPCEVVGGEVQNVGIIAPVVTYAATIAAIALLSLSGIKLMKRSNNPFNF